MCSKRNPSGVNVINVIDTISIEKPHRMHVTHTHTKEEILRIDFLEDTYILYYATFIYMFTLLFSIIKMFQNCTHCAQIYALSNCLFTFYIIICIK